MVATTDAQRTSFRDLGYVVLPRRYSDAFLDELRAALADPQTPLFGMCRVNEAIRRHVFDTTLGAVAADLLAADEVRLLSDNTLTRAPQRTGDAANLVWHQDHPYWPVLDPTHLTCLVALDPLTSDAGAMRYVPKSHRWGEFANVDHASGRLLDAADGRPRVPIDPASDGHEIVTIELAPGEFLLHHCFVWHASGFNRSKHDVRAITTRSMARGTTYQPKPDRADGTVPGPRRGDSLDDDGRYPVLWPPREPNES
jgi:ectoine hydroxylase-related dioxygenase (phytanoyl-CoA dioxygenase family)